MVVGNGLIGRTFSNYKLNKEVLIFASGVSNSSANNHEDFEREKRLFLESISKYTFKRAIYFSTCSIYDDSILGSAYVKHKLEMEELVRNNCTDYIIFRVSNVVGKIGNPNTLINYFTNAVTNVQPIKIWKQAQRNIIDIEDVKFIVERKIHLGTKNKTINIAVRKSEFVVDILAQVEHYLGKVSRKELISKGCELQIDTCDISDELSVIESKKGEGLQYINTLLRKYY
ncbi:NAD-dependent epimerase/dehydratase family protein [Psychroserpens damuponensis]|uniref:NAD-dependent epimerase/dehydratase family protein n=1 Tax=Psychroserpens damuponensis TaxID=943936 RepID=UPI0005900F31|nr:NAD-dependent epimerase/dehydratase family protein [Psychroserpens damuponensis]